jgi:hypothetical protein
MRSKSKTPSPESEPLEGLDGVVRLHAYPSVPSSDNDPGVRPSLSDGSSRFASRHAWHGVVGEDDVELLAAQNFQSRRVRWKLGPSAREGR